MEEPPRRIRKTGGYRNLRSFQITTLIYDGTVAFCKNFVDFKSRTNDQMIQAARSGRQNIAEGNRAGAVSSHSELLLTNVARASQEELLLDFQDYLRQDNLPLWGKDSPEAEAVRQLGRRDRSDQTDRSDLLSSPEDAGDRARYQLYRPWLENKDPTVIANTLICLIHQANFLLDQQLLAMEQNFISEGGYKEQLASARIAERNKPDDSSPKCEDCGKPMSLRTARQGKNEGSQFWGCSGYPECKKTMPV